VASPPRVLSAGNTLFFKVVPPIVVFGEAAYFLHGTWPAGVVMLIPAFWLAWVFAKFKRVALDETSLHVSNFVHEIVVPLHEIDRVSERFRPLRAIVVDFTPKNRFGRRIEFSPEGRTHPPPPHPFLIELEMAIGAAKRSKEAGSARGYEPIARR
jgi:hypothetical protein